MRRLNEYGFQHGIFKWFEGWKIATRRTDVEVSAEVQLKGPSSVCYMDFTLCDFASDRTLVAELKRVPLNKIDLDKGLGSRRSKAALSKFLRGANSSIDLEEGELLELPLIAGYVPHRLASGRTESDLRVQDVLDDAVEQPLPMLELYPHVGVLHAFVVVMIHRWVVVRQVVV